MNQSAPIERLSGKPDGSYIFIDSTGKEKFGWMPPSLLKHILSQPGVRRLVHVRIREPDDRVHDDFWPVDESVVQRLADVDGVVHVMSLFEDGEIRYNFISRKVWDRLDAMLAVFGNPSLSEAEKQIRAQEIMKS